jgi:hypothetical protein
MVDQKTLIVAIYTGYSVAREYSKKKITTVTVALPSRGPYLSYNLNTDFTNQNKIFEF